MNLDDIIVLLNKAFTEDSFQKDQNNIIDVSKNIFVDVCTYLQQTEQLYFDQLACITGLDNIKKEACFEVIYNLYSIPYEHELVLRLKVSEETPNVPSVVKVWKAADWLEREVFDMYGIYFDEHPDLRRILMPANWEGFPLRKDYKTQEYYHGIKVDY